MFYRLKERCLLRGWEKLPHAVIDRRAACAVFISFGEMEALQLCNGKINTDLPLIDPKIREMLPMIELTGYIEKCRQGDTILPEQEYRVYPSHYIRTAHSFDDIGRHDWLRESTEPKHSRIKPFSCARTGLPARCSGTAGQKGWSI